MPNKPPMTFLKTHPAQIVAESVAQSSPNGPREHITAAEDEKEKRDPLLSHNKMPIAPKYNHSFMQILQVYYVMGKSY